MLISKEGHTVHTLIAETSNDGKSVIGDRTVDGIRLDHEYTLEYTIIDTPDQASRPPLKIYATGIEMIQGINEAVRRTIQSSDTSPLNIDMFDVRQSCRGTLSIYATLRIMGSSSSVTSMLKSTYPAGLVDFVKRSHKHSQDSDLVRKMITGYMWLSFTRTADEDHVLVQDYLTISDDRISELIENGQWTRCGGYGRVFNTPQEFSRTMKDGAVLNSFK